MLKGCSANIGIWGSNMNFDVTERSADLMDRLLGFSQIQNRHVPYILLKKELDFFYDIQESTSTDT